MSKILILGGGSIGKRHLRNLLALGKKDILVVETNVKRAEEVTKEFSVSVFTSVAEAAEKDFKIVFVCTPSVYHLENALLFAKKGCNLFIEKPLAHSLEGVDELVKVSQQKKLVTMVGSNWKFYPLFQKMKALLEAGVVGKIFSARCQFGQYLPDWHPWEDYRHGYSANRKLGGGILLDSHEFDYLTWFIGQPVKKIACFADKVSNLEVDVEDVAEVILQFESGAIGEIHLDYLQRFYQRNFEFFGELGTLSWNALEKKVIVQNKETGQEEFPLPESYDINQMYLEEAKHFLKCVSERSATLTPLEKGAEVVRLIQAAHESARSNNVIFLK